MSTIAEILDRLSGVVVLRERLTETNRNVDRSLAWLLDHEKRLIHIEASGQMQGVPGKAARPKLPRGKT